MQSFLEETYVALMKPNSKMLYLALSFLMISLVSFVKGLLFSEVSRTELFEIIHVFDYGGVYLAVKGIAESNFSL